jgi:hypothetical protein
MKYLILFVILIGVSFAFVHAQSQVVPHEKTFVPYTENYNVRFTSDGFIDYDLLIAKIMPQIFEKKLHGLGANVTSQDIVLNRGPSILMYQPQSYTCGYVIDFVDKRVYWLEAAINSTQIQYANVYDKVPRDVDFQYSFEDCFSPLEIQVAEKLLQEKSYFTSEEEVKVVALVKHYLRGNENLNKFQFNVGKFNFDYKDKDILSFCGSFVGKKAGLDYFLGAQNSKGEFHFELSDKTSSLCAFAENPILYDIKYDKKSNSDESLQTWKNIRLESVHLKSTSTEKLLERNYLYADYINHNLFYYASPLNLISVDYQPENSNTILKFTPYDEDSYMMIRLPDSGGGYYVPYGVEDWNQGKLLGVSIFIDGKEVSYNKSSHVDYPYAPYPIRYTDMIFKVPANSINVAIKLEIENYNFTPKDTDGWRDYFTGK